MSRIRTIKPEFPQSETIGKLSRDARLLFIQLWTIVDDAGRVRGASRMLASLLYPYDDDAPSLVEGWMGELERCECITRYDVAGSKYLQIINWLEHQKIDHPAKSRIPDQNGLVEVSESKRDTQKPSRDLRETLAKPSEGVAKAQEPVASLPEALAPDLGPRTLTLDLVPKEIPLTKTQGGVSETKPKRTRKLGVYEGEWDFEAFWLAYPRKTDKGDARKAMLQVERSGIVTFDVMMAGIANIDASDLQFVKQPAAWLRAEGWGNAVVTRTSKPIPGAPVPFQMKAKAKPRVMLDVATFNAETWKVHINRYLRDQTWDEDQLGPDPESKGCHIPKAVLDANGIRRPPITVNLNNGQKPQAWPTTPTPTVPDIEEFTQ